MIDAAVRDIESLIEHHEFVVYGFQRFGDTVLRSVHGAGSLPFDLARAAFRTSLSRFCPEPVAVRKFYSTGCMQSWAEERGVRGLIGVYPAGASTKVYLSDVTGLVLCRLEFG